MAQSHALITEEALADLRKSIAVEVTSRGVFNDYSGKDVIRHFAHATGDANPLFCDEEYARNTRWGGIIAPPCFLFTMMGRARQGLPGIHAMWSGAEFECLMPIRADERITSTVHLSALTEKSSRFARRTVLQENTHIFRYQSGDVLAKVKEWSIRTERGTAHDQGKYKRLAPQRYTTEEIRAIEADYDKEDVRGSIPRYWEDVNIGDELPPVVKGPLTVTDVIAFKIGWGFSPFVRAHRIALDYRRRHPGVSILNSMGIPDVPERVHWEDELAQDVGVPAAYDYGPQRASWLGHLMTNWIGDDGFLKRLRVEVRRFNLIGDTTWCRGKVSAKYVEGGEHLVDCDILAEDQRGEITAPGSATVILPSRGE